MESELRRRLADRSGRQADADSGRIALAECADDRAQSIFSESAAGGYGRADAPLRGAAAAGAGRRIRAEAGARRDPGAHAIGVRACRCVGSAGERIYRGVGVHAAGRSAAHRCVGYRPNGIVRMFHAVSLEPGIATGLDVAKVLAFSAAALRAGVERVEKAELELTAVIEPAARGWERRTRSRKRAGALSLRRGDDGGACDSRADHLRYGPGGGDGAARTPRVKSWQRGNSEKRSQKCGRRRRLR